MQVEGRAHDPYVSFDQAADRLEKRLRRYKRRLKDHHAGANAATASNWRLLQREAPLGIARSSPIT